jgi:hypothetical protein
MTSEEFRNLIQQQSALQMLDPCLRDDQTPYVFKPKPAAWNMFRDELVSRLNVKYSDIRIVGSARLGFSMTPGRNLKEFRDTSDIDVIIVNSDLFDELWLALLEAAYPRGWTVHPLSQEGWLKERKDELYTGWFTPLAVSLDSKIYGSKAESVLQFNLRWFNALKEAARHPPRRHSDVTSRLYRTWRHAELYHLDSLAALRKALSRTRSTT